MKSFIPNSMLHIKGKAPCEVLLHPPCLLPSQCSLFPCFALQMHFLYLHVFKKVHLVVFITFKNILCCL